MNPQVALEEQAIDQAAFFLRDDPDGLRATFEAIDRPPQDPQPAQSFAFGASGLRRLQVGRYRVLYRITDHQVVVGHIGRISAG